MTDLNVLGRVVHRRDGSILAFAKERYDEIINDIKPLLIEHWLELATYSDIPLSPKYDFYRAADTGGFIRIYSARLDGKLIGYVIMTCMKEHPHYQTQPWSVSDIVLIVKEHRRFGVGNGLFDFLETDLKGHVVDISCKVTHPELQMLLLSRSYTVVATILSKRC